MANLIKKSLSVKLVCAFLLVAIVPIGIVGYLSFHAARSSLVHAYSEKLQATGEDRKRSILEFFEETVLDSRFVADSQVAEKAFAMIDENRRQGRASQGADKADPELVRKIHTEVGPVFEAWERLYGRKNGYHDLLLVDTDGYVAYTLKKESDLGADLARGALKDTGLRNAWKKALDSRKPALVDFQHYKPSAAPAAFCAIPFIDRTDKILGTIVVQLGTDGINHIFSDAESLGKTAEAYAVGKDMLMRSNSRFEQDRKSSILVKKIDTEPTRAALEGNSGIKFTTDYRKEPVLSFFTPAGINKDPNLGADFDWALITEIDESEVMAPVQQLALRMVVIAGVISLLTAGLALFISRTITKPVISLSTQLVKAGDGDLSVDIPGKDRSDEIGVLAQSIDLLVSNLRIKGGKILEAANVVAVAASEISATAIEVVASTSKTTAAVTESATTAAQLKQAAQVAGQRAKEVAHSALEAVDVSTVGRKATEGTVDKIDLIKNQMESIGETVVKLSEHSQAILDIIVTVQDIADQSNLLAVNASIEAARAGDQGKGFAVVAHEIKILADQSKKSTEQVRQILDDTRRWVSAVVMATEQGGKAVTAGVEQAESAGKAIDSLATGIEGWARAASVVDISSQQQVAGAEQVAFAMTNIEQAMQQTLTGVSQLETAAKRLEEMSGAMNELLSDYRGLDTQDGDRRQQGTRT